MQIEVKELRKEYCQKKQPIAVPVKDVSFSVKKGEMIAFIGPNGAGKSTTIKMLTGIISRTKGSIQVLGLDPSQDREALAYQIGGMFGQKSNFNMHLNVIDNFKFLCLIYDISKYEADKRIDEIVNLFGISSFMDQPVKKLSLGQRMICEIAAVMLHQPKIIFLDEPTIGLDIIVKQKVRDIIRILNAKGTTIFLTSHDISDVQELCNRIIVINHGVIVKDVSMEKLKEEYFAKRYVKVSYAKECNVKNFAFEIIHQTGCEINFVVNMKHHPLDEILSYLETLGTVVDFQLETLPMEYVIEQIYQEEHPI